MADSAKVLGLKRLNAKVHAMNRAVKQAIREALEEGAEEIVAMMKRLAPRKDGDLIDSISWTFGQPPSGSISLGTIGDERNMQGLRITIFAGGPEAPHARWQEFGTTQHPAQPYFFVAYRALRKRVKGRITRKMNKAIKQVAGNG